MSDDNSIDVSSLQSDTFASPEVLVALVDAEVRDGRLSREQADAMLRADGVEPPQREQSDPLFERAKPPGEAEAVEDLPGMRAARPEEFKLPPLVEPGHEYTPEVAQFDRQVRGWLSAAELPAEIGSFVGMEIYREAARLQDASDAEREAVAERTLAQLRRDWGAEAPGLIGLVNQLLAEVDTKQPGLMQYLDDSGARYSYSMYRQLGEHVKRLRTRGRG